MNKFEIEGMKDLWEDFTSSIIKREVNLSKAKIYQVKEVISTDKNVVVKLLMTDVDTMSQKKVKMNMTADPDIIRLMKYSGCLYRIGNEFYIPNENVKRRCIYDYFEKPYKGINLTGLNAGSRPSMNVNCLSDNANTLNLAYAFKRSCKMLFLGVPLTSKLTLLTGMKSAKTRYGTTGISIAEALHEKYNVQDFWTTYIGKEKESFDFKFYCKVNDIKSVDGTDLYVSVCDNVMGRKSIQVDILADIDGRKYIVKNVEVEHRSLKSSYDIADTIYDVLDVVSRKYVKKNISAEEIEEATMQHIPKRERSVFETKMKDAKNPIATAYDIMHADIFNLSRKSYKTMEYDAGKRKYELALGAALLSEN